MNKDNVFRSSSFYMSEGDVLHIEIIDATGNIVPMDLCSTVNDIAEDSSVITISTSKVGSFSIDLKGDGDVIFNWGDGSAEDIIPLSGMGTVTVTHVFASGGTINIQFDNLITSLIADAQDITDIVIPASATAIKTISLEGNDLTMFRTQRTWTDLESLKVSNNNLTSIVTYSEWIKLKLLWAYGNNLTTIDTHPEWVKMEDFEVYQNSMVSLSIPQEWIKIKYLQLFQNPLTSLTTYPEWVDLIYLDISGTLVASIDLWDTWVNLQYLQLWYTPITEFTTYSNWVQLSLLNAYLNDLTQDTVNNVLIEADSSGIVAGTINLSLGTSPAPSGAGITAKNNLIAKGLTITTN